MKLPTQYSKRSRDFLRSADSGASSALHGWLALMRCSVYAVGRGLGEGQLILQEHQKKTELID